MPGMSLRLISFKSNVTTTGFFGDSLASRLFWMISRAR